MADFDVVGSIQIDGDTGSLDQINSGLDGMSGTADSASLAFAGLGTAILSAVGSAALSAIQSLGSGLMNLVGDSLGAADKHDKAIAQISAALAANTAATDDSTASGGQWVTTTGMSTKAADGLQKKIAALSTSIADQNEKDALMGKTSKATQVSLEMKGQKLAALNTQLADGTKATKVWVDGVAAAQPITQMTLQGIESLSESMSRKTLFSSDQYLAASQYLVQMRTIGKDVFPAAMQATADLATRMNVDLSTAAMTVGKALADPSTGIGRLNTQFKLFDKEQLKSVEYMAAHGQMAKAQTTILDALTKSVGGAADAAEQAGLGPWQVLQNKFADMQDQIGNALIPAIDNVANALGPVLDQVMPKLSDFLQNQVGPALTAASKGVATFITQIADGVSPMDALNSALLDAGLSPAQIKSIDDFAQGVANFVSGIPAAISSVGDFINGIKQFAANVALGLNTAKTDISQFGQTVATSVGNWIQSVTLGAQGIVKSVQTGMAQFVANVLLGFNSAVTGASQFGSQIETSVINWVQSVLTGAKNFIAGGQAIITNIVSGIQSAVSSVSTLLSNLMTDQAAHVTLLGQNFMDSGGSIITNIINGITGVIDSVGTELAKGPAGWIKDMTTAIGQFASVGASIITGIISGIEANIGQIASTLLGGLSDAWAKAKAFIGMGSPSKLFATMGTSIASGLALGIQNTARMPMTQLNALTSQLVGASNSAVYHQNKTVITNNFGGALYQPQQSGGDAFMQATRKF